MPNPPKTTDKILARSVCVHVCVCLIGGSTHRQGHKLICVCVCVCVCVQSVRTLQQDLQPPGSGQPPAFLWCKTHQQLNCLSSELFGA